LIPDSIRRCNSISTLLDSVRSCIYSLPLLLPFCPSSSNICRLRRRHLLGHGVQCELKWLKPTLTLLPRLAQPLHALPRPPPSDDFNNPLGNALTVVSNSEPSSLSIFLCMWAKMPSDSHARPVLPFIRMRHRALSTNPQPIHELKTRVSSFCTPSSSMLTPRQHPYYLTQTVLS
jgi:hypothetical protein